MFGTNEKIGKKYFQDAPVNTLNVSTAFYTLQGEGPLTGQPAVFLRLAKCQLSCSFCDTYFDKGETLTFPQVFEKLAATVERHFKLRSSTVPDWANLRGTLRYPARLALVITGGEPLLQDNLHSFLWEIQHKSGFSPSFEKVQIETNGILPWSGDEETILVVSPKCVEDKDGNPLHHIRPAKVTLERANCLKFVVTSDSESAYNTVPDWAFTWRDQTRRPIYISPMNIYHKEPQAALTALKTNPDISLEERSETLERISFWESGLLDMKANQANHEWAAELCLRHGFVLSLQTHLLASLP